MKHGMKYMLPALCAAVLCLSGSSILSASAYTADDVAAKARAAGWPENLIQQGYNEWASGNYTQDQLDKAYNSVSQYSDQTGQMIRDALGLEEDDAPAPTNAPTNAPTDAPNTPAPTVAPANTPAATEAPANNTPTAPAGQQNNQGGNTAAADAPAQQSGTLTVTKTDGTTEERISKSDFINMTIEEKKNYVNSLTPQSKQDFMDSLSIEERNSILKQLPADEKADLIQNYVDTAKEMGMNVSVDSLEDNSVSLTMRNEEGQVIGKTAVGTIIDETGISHTGQLMTAMLAALISVLGFAVLYRYLSRIE